MINSNRLKLFLDAAQHAKSAWIETGLVLASVDRYDRAAWAQALESNQQALDAYNSSARSVTTVMQLLVEQAEYESEQRKDVMNLSSMTSIEERNPT
jgi:hypothetical protein